MSEPDAYEYGDGGAVAYRLIWPDHAAVEHGKDELLKPLYGPDIIQEKTLREVPDELEIAGDQYTFLGETDTGLLQFYRVDEDEATVALLEQTSDGEYVDRQPIRLRDGEPWDALQRYAYNQSWKHREEISRANRDVPPPIHNPEQNTALDGSIVLDDYLFPMRAERDIQFTPSLRTKPGMRTIS